jgi:hypothetical protein
VLRLRFHFGDASVDETALLELLVDGFGEDTDRPIGIIVGVCAPA